MTFYPLCDTLTIERQARATDQPKYSHLTMKNVSIENIAPNFTKVWFQGSGWIAFSYKTPIAFAHGGRVVVRQNDWSTTTGKHLNHIDGGSVEAKKARLSSSDFESAMSNYDVSLRQVFAGFPN